MAAVPDDENKLFEFTWAIRNFSLCLKRPNETILSPWIYHFDDATIYGSVKFELWFQKSFPNSLICAVKLNDDLYNLKSFKVLCLKQDGQVYYESQGQRKTVKLLDRMLLMRNATHTDDVLRLKFQLKFEFDTLNIIEGTEEMVRKLRQLQECGDFSDLVIKSKGEEFLVHKFLLQTRAPRFLQSLNILKNGENSYCVEVEEIPSGHIKFLLSYIYGKESLRCLNEKDKKPLIAKCKQFGLDDLMSRINFNKPINKVWTTMKTIRKSVECTIGSVDEKCVSTNQVFMHFIDLDLLTFEIKLSTQKNELGKQSTDVIVLNMKCQDNATIFFKCLAALGNKYDDNHQQETYERLVTFTKGKFRENWKWTIFTFENDERKLSSLCLDFAISDGAISHDYEFIPDSKIENNYLNMYVLHKNLCDLYRYTNKIFPDVKLHCGGGVLDAHRALLSAWSPVFNKMFQNDTKEKHEGIVKITDVDFKTMENFLVFIYCGVMYDYGHKELINLYTAADKYEVLQLRKQCNLKLSSRLCVQDVCFLLTIADTHSDMELMNASIEYITLHWDEINDTLPWINMVKNSPALACKVLMNVTKHKP